MNLDSFIWYSFWVGIFLAFVSMFLGSILGEILFLVFSFICAIIGTRGTKPKEKKK